MKDNNTPSDTCDLPHDNAATKPRQSSGGVRLPDQPRQCKSRVALSLLTAAILAATISLITIANAQPGTPPATAQPATTRPAANPPAAPDAPSAQRIFTVFDATLYQDKPDLSEYWVKPMVSLGASLFATNRRPTPAELENPDEGHIRAVARSLARRKTVIVCLDIEHWPTRGDDAEVAASVERYTRVAQWMHDEVPGLRLGFYGVPPLRRYWDAILPADSPRYQRWQQENDALVEIARQADVLFPSLYTFYEDQQSWEKFATASIAEARRLNKVVYPFIWPYYHDGGPPELRLKPIPREFWRKQLETIHAQADGLVIWGGWTDAQGRRMTWDDNAPWWQETVQFLKDKGIKPPPAPPRAE